MIRLYALRCIACERPWCATPTAVRHGGVCPFCGGPSRCLKLGHGRPPGEVDIGTLRAALGNPPVPVSMIALRAGLGDAHVRSLLSGGAKGCSQDVALRLTEAFGLDPVDVGL